LNKRFEEETEKELIFECDNIKYYQFINGGTPMYYARFKQFQETMRKHEEWRINDSVLSEYIDMVSSLTQNKGLDSERRIAEIARVTEMIKWRREQSNDLQLIYELASIWYFDESEDPSKYDYSHAQEKIKSWMKSNECTIEGVKYNSLLSFFLQTPLNRYINFRDLSESGTLKYLQKTTETMLSHSMHNSLLLSEKEKGESMGLNISSLMETYQNLNYLIGLELENISTTRQKR